jgi:hypothetical protein
MFNRIARTIAAGAALIALVTPAALASPLGTDPEPRVIHAILHILGIG